MGRRRKVVVSVGCMVVIAFALLASTATTHVVEAQQDDISDSNDTSSCGGIFFDYFAGSNTDSVQFGYFLIYLFLLIYIFIGVSVTAEFFMQAIEFITSQKKVVVEGDQTTQVHIWNGTVANLTLMALGSSAPEILLSVVEVVGNGFNAGELGPGTIVGSAAFNMLIIIAVCVNIKKNRKIKQIRVFYTTYAFSVFAYLWLYFIVANSSEAVIDVWEAVVTVLFFPVLVLAAWLFDKQTQRKEKARKEGNLSSLLTKLGTETTAPEASSHTSSIPQHQVDYIITPVTRVGRAKYRQKLDAALKEVQRTDPNLSAGEQYIEANRIVNKKLKGIDALESGEDVASRATQGLNALGMGLKDVVPPQIGFIDANLVVHKSHRSVSVRIARLPPTDGYKAPHISIRYKTVEGTAFQGVHFHTKEGVLMFPSSKDIVILSLTIDIVPTTPHHRNKNFSIQLESATGHPINWKKRVASVTIQQCPYPNNILEMIRLWYRSVSEQLSEDEEADTPYIEQIRVALRIDGGDDDDDDDDDDGAGDDDEDGEVDENGMVKESSYVKFKDNKDSDDDDDDDDSNKPLYIGSQDEEKQYSIFDYAQYILLVFWNVTFAILTPPTHSFGGWATFGLSLVYIGLLTAFVGDLATGLGCTVGLKDTVTAITFVALGTSVPDVFASKIAAEKEPTADDAVGNVTGSNAVNVFLGVGLAWLLGAAFHSSRGTVFKVNDPALGFSVVVFCTIAVIWFIVMTWRRNVLGAELGGPRIAKRNTIIFFVFLWFVYILLSSLVAYNKFSPGF
eukprot:m.135311 g.135311  ORF g.135311 m.135311 type:complete len:789 (+) comp9897_c0_seq1:114-2480(+)